MVGVRSGSKLVNIAARCSIVDFNLKVIYDEYIRPEKKIVDYRTTYSGIRKEHMENATPFKDARAKIMWLLKGKIIIGQSLYNDFESLAFSWPRSQRRDLSECLLLYKKVGMPYGKKKLSLQKFTAVLLHRDIQIGSHCSVEDAIASMELYKLVCVEWEKEFHKK